MYNSNTVLSFSDSRILNLYNPSKMSSGGIFVIDNKFSSHFVEVLNIIISKNYCKQVGIILDRVVGSGDPEVLVDQVSDLSSSEAAVFFLSFHFLQTDLFLEAGVLDDSFQC